jgi:predicted nucleic-acid-binding protein
MIALDTNILARLLLADDSKQFAQARELLSLTKDFTAPITVMLELVWVLETYELSSAEISEALSKLLSLPNFKPAHEAQLREALALYTQGMDFADALHWRLSAGEEQFVTMDRKMASKANKFQRDSGQSLLTDAASYLQANKAAH